MGTVDSSIQHKGVFHIYIFIIKYLKTSMDPKFICLITLGGFFILDTTAVIVTGYGCKDLYDGGYEDFHNYDKYCYESKIDSQQFCIGNYGGRIAECTDLSEGIQFVFDDGRSNPMRFNKMGESECQNYNPDYLGNLAWSLGYSNFTVNAKKSGNLCTFVSLDECGKFQTSQGINSVEKPYKISFWGSFSEFYNGVAGGVCNNEGDVIRSEEECTEALAELGYQSAKKEYWEGSKKNIPSGCSIRSLNNRPYLNTKPGVGRGRDDQIPICKGNRKLAPNCSVN